MHSMVFARASLTACISALLLAGTVLRGQSVTTKSVPLGDQLKRALEASSLTGGQSRPFHLKIKLIESTNPSSEYRAEIEEYWVSPEQSHRSIDSPDFKQTLITSNGQVSEQDTGDYFPLWLRNFIRAIADPVPNADLWEGLHAQITQIKLPNGQQSEACARVKFKIGSATVKNDAFGNLCFGDKGLVTFVGTPGYSMEFHDYKKFGKQWIARRYQDDPEPGTELVAKIIFLGELKKPDASLFSVAPSTSSRDSFRSVPVTQATIEQAAESEPAIKWPPVTSGKTSGLLSMYISVGRDGRVREAYPLNSDNAGLQDTARDQLLKWRIKPIAIDGYPVQVESAMSFHFDTTLSDATQPATSSTPAAASSASAPITVRTSPAILRALLISDPQPEYPAAAKQKHIQGAVVLTLTLDEGGVPKDIRVVSSPDDSLTQSAVAAVKQWRYKPYLLNSVPVQVQSTVTLSFDLP
jgi:TonB family protein